MEQIIEYNELKRQMEEVSASMDKKCAGVMKALRVYNKGWMPYLVESINKDKSLPAEYRGVREPVVRQALRNGVGSLDRRVAYYNKAMELLESFKTFTI